MDDRSKRSRLAGFVTFIDRFFLGGCQGGLIGAVTAAAAGCVFGAAAGACNEATAAGDAYDDLFVGFAEYSMYGMAVFGFLVGGPLGFGGGFFAGATACVTHRAWAGWATGGG